ncbi:hypothetical protein, unknown function [Leishmania tarentolae]|uniref:Uncharacterized protein n=1 Tax=Leishmania tarentolae TaxID=5689 RepID=A0A640KSZ5_LEITA|nr:hypothetical protein, unknown function [Leishmania tarentolae]GET90667.1 hypothetical protein, unknown function [Leishmania tarentolae]GET94006.1 hypothetical protein, unknown function [Leishmania tarentolae]GET94012.1 hypothetical protein, unknown function [Leishmania tarentolae]
MVTRASLDVLNAATGPLVSGADANSEEASRRKPHTGDRSALDATLHRERDITQWKSVLCPDSDHYWITFPATVGNDMELIAPTRPQRDGKTTQRC